VLTVHAGAPIELDRRAVVRCDGVMQPGARSLVGVVAAVVAALAAGQGRTARAQAPGDAAPAAAARQPAWELFAGLGPGDAVCDNEQPDSDCPVDGAVAIVLGGGWRFRDHLSWGGELGFWGYKIREAWRGGLNDPATDVSFHSVYLATHLRWYWFDRVGAQPYLQGGLGLGSTAARASNDTGAYHYSGRGVVFPVAIGVDWPLGRRFRLGGQAQAYLQVSTTICSDGPTTAEECRSPGTNANGDREGLVLPWRIVVIGTYTL